MVRGQIASRTVLSISCSCPECLSSKCIHISEFCLWSHGEGHLVKRPQQIAHVEATEGPASKRQAYDACDHRNDVPYNFKIDYKTRPASVIYQPAEQCHGNLPPD